MVPCKLQLLTKDAQLKKVLIHFFSIKKKKIIIIIIYIYFQAEL